MTTCTACQRNGTGPCGYPDYDPIPDGCIRAEPEFSIVTLDEFLKYPYPKAESLIGVPSGGTNLLPKRGWMLAWGIEGCGKTSIMIDLVFHGAEALDWIGYTILKPIRFVAVINEGDPGGLQLKLSEKLESWHGDPEKVLDNLAVLASPFGRFTLQDERGRLYLRDKARDFGADYCFLDPLHTLGTIGAGTPAETEAFKKLLQEVGLWESVGMLTPHHANKSGMVSGDWGRHPDTLIRLEKDPGRKATKWTIQKARPVDPDELDIPQILEWDTETFGYTRREARDNKAVGATNRMKVLDAAWLGATAKEISAVVGISDKTVLKHLNDLQTGGHLKLVGDTTKATYVASIENETGHE